MITPMSSADIPAFINLVTYNKTWKASWGLNHEGQLGSWLSMPLIPCTITGPLQSISQCTFSFKSFSNILSCTLSPNYSNTI